MASSSSTQPRARKKPATAKAAVEKKAPPGKSATALPLKKIEFNLINDKIGYLKVVQRADGFRDSFTDGPVWRDTFADGGHWLSNFNNMGVTSDGLRHPAVQAALEKVREAASVAAAAPAKKS
jgi:hypothetical protein